MEQRIQTGWSQHHPNGNEVGSGDRAEPRYGADDGPAFERHRASPAIPDVRQPPGFLFSNEPLIDAKLLR